MKSSNRKKPRSPSRRSKTGPGAAPSPASTAAPFPTLIDLHDAAEALAAGQGEKARNAAREIIEAAARLGAINLMGERFNSTTKTWFAAAITASELIDTHILWRDASDEPEALAIYVSKGLTNVRRLRMRDLDLPDLAEWFKKWVTAKPDNRAALAQQWWPPRGGSRWKTTATFAYSRFWLPIFAMNLPFVEAIASYQGVTPDQALTGVDVALKNIVHTSEIAGEDLEFLIDLSGTRGTPDELYRLDRLARGLLMAKLESDSPSRLIVLRLFDPGLVAETRSSEALQAAARDALVKPYDKASTEAVTLQTRWPSPGGETPVPVHLKFSSPWWNLYQALVWVAVRTREAVDMAGHKPGWRVFTAIDNVDSRRLSAHRAQAKIHDALSDGRLVGFRLVNGKPFPAAKLEWTAAPFDLWGILDLGEWWLNYRLLSEDVLNLWPARSAVDIPKDAAGTAAPTGKVAASTTKKAPSRKNSKTTGNVRIFDVFNALYNEGADPKKMRVKELCLEVLRREGKSGKHGLGKRNVERALAKWKSPTRPTE